MPEYNRGYEDLIAGMISEVLTVSVIVKKGSGVIERGMVLGLIDQLQPRAAISSAGMYIVAPVNSLKIDGSERPFAVLADELVDATSTDVRATAYKSGEFNRDALKFGGTDTITDHERELNRIGIITRRITDMNLF